MMKKILMILVSLTCMVSFLQAAPVNSKVALKELQGGKLVIQGSKIRVEFDANGEPLSLSRLGDEGKVEWTLPQKPESMFWMLRMGKDAFNPDNAKRISTESGCDSIGAFVQSVWEEPKLKMRVTVTYRVTDLEQDRLRANYTIDNGSTKDQIVKFYFSMLSNFKVGEDKWVVYPYRSGKLMRSDKVKYSEQPAPGHMWMQFMGYYDQANKNGLIMYPEDRTGYLKFANHWPSRDLTLSWRCGHFIEAGQRYVNRFDYVVRPLATPNDFNEICYAYGEWARKQGWMSSAAEKMKERSALKNLSNDGIVKICGMGGLSQSKTKWIPVKRGVQLPYEKKEQMATATSFSTNLRNMRSLEKLYDVKPVYRFDGWWGRFDAEYPFILPINKMLGGNKAFKEFCEENNKDARTVVLHANPIQYDVDMPQYNDKHMMKTRDGKPMTSVWSGNKLVVPSPRFALVDNLKMLFQIQKWGATGVFWDVIGAGAPHTDFNKEANYPLFMEDCTQQGCISIMAALRDGAPEMIYGTEDGQEQMLPYFDYAAAYFNYGDNKTLTWAPLTELVYGDAFFNAVGIDGNNQSFNDPRRVSRRLFGAALGQDARQQWVKEYDPLIQQIFEVNRVIGCVATKRMQKHIIAPEGWRASFWENAVVTGNITSEKSLDIVIEKSPLGKIEANKVRKNGFAIVSAEGNWVAWGVGELKLNGKTLVSCSNPDSIIVKNTKGITLASYGFYGKNGNPKRGSFERNVDESPWEIICGELGSKKIVAQPSGKRIKKKTKVRAIILPAPGVKQAYRAR